MKTTQSIKAVIMTVMASVAMSAAAQTDKQESIILYSYGQVTPVRDKIAISCM